MNRSKAPLSLMEQLVMLLVFALAAALCLQIFVFSGQLSRSCEARDHAVTEVQNAAEAVKLCSGNAEEYEKLLGGTSANGVLSIGFDEKWNSTETENAEYTVTVAPQPAEGSMIGTADISAQNKNGETIFSVSVSWQEVSHG